MPPANACWPTCSARAPPTAPPSTRRRSATRTCRSPSARDRRRISATAALTERGAVNRRDDLALLVAAGDGLCDGRAHTGEILRALRDTPVAAIAESSRAGFVAVAVPRATLKAAMAAVHARFFEPRHDRFHLAVPRFVRLASADGLAGEEAIL